MTGARTYDRKGMSATTHVQQPVARQGWLQLRRITSGSSWIPEIDGLRFVAIACVVLFHLSAEVGVKSGIPLTTHAWYHGVIAAMNRGDIGVRIFFVISGFILGRPFARHYLLGHPMPSLRAYYLRRLTRLEPPYLLNIAICTLAMVLYVHVPLRVMLPHFAASAVYLHGLLLGNIGAPNPVAWTLEMEVQFYLLVPLLTLVFLIRSAWLRRTVLAGFSIALPLLLTLFVIGKIANPHLWASIAWLLQYFIAGLLLSDLYVTSMPSWRASWLWDVASTAAWVVLLATDHPHLYVLEPLLIALAFMGAFRGKLLRRLFTTEWIAILGGMCYSMYLWHFFVIALVFKLSRRWLVSHDLLTNIALQGLIILPCVVAFTIIYFVLIERPCMDPAWPEKLRAAMRGAARRPEAA
jgi:peptidoglycan/LPS O-acetylase OafA/YrhL